MDARIGRDGEREEFTPKNNNNNNKIKPPKAILFFCDVIKVTVATYDYLWEVRINLTRFF